MKIKVIEIAICEACLEGIGQECHTPGCALWLHAVDLPIHAELYTVLREYDSEEGWGDSDSAPLACGNSGGGE